MKTYHSLADLEYIFGNFLESWRWLHNEVLLASLEINFIHGNKHDLSCKKILQHV